MARISRPTARAPGRTDAGVARQTVPLTIPDLSAFSKALADGLRTAGGVPSHAALMSLLAQAAGYRNYAHLRAVVMAAQAPATDLPLSATDTLPPAPLPHARLTKVARLFDAQGRLTRWPTKRAEQVLCLWVIWARLPEGDIGGERVMNARLTALHTFGDPAILRRDLVDMGLVARTADVSAYRRLPADPPPEVRALLALLAG